MTCTLSRGVVLCQTDPLGALAVVTAIALALIAAYQLGLTRSLMRRLADETSADARIAQTSDEDPRRNDAD